MLDIFKKKNTLNEDQNKKLTELEPKPVSLKKENINQNIANNDNDYNDYDDYNNDYDTNNDYNNSDNYAKDEAVADLYAEIISDDNYNYNKEVNSPEDIMNMVRNNKFFDQLKQISRNGHVLTVTGVGGAGASTVACNIAYTLGFLGLKTLLIDFDTELRTQHMISKDNFESMGTTSCNVKTALLDDVDKVFKKITITRKNVHLLASGISCEPERLHDFDNQVKLMLNILKRDYEFIICDIPIHIAIEDMPVTIENSDDIIMVTEGCSLGILNTINYICNIDNSFLLQNIFSKKTKIIFNKLRPVKKLYNKSINLLNPSCLRVIDKVVSDIADCDIGYYFSDMRLLGCIDIDNTFEQFVGEKTQYCDTTRGKLVMLNIINELISM